MVNLGYINYILKTKLIRFLPYKARRPFLLVSLFTGLYGYFRFMIVISSGILGSPSIYLVQIQNAFITAYGNLVSVVGKVGTAGITVLVFACLMYKYCLPVVSKENRKNDTYYARSLYYSINKAVSIMYLIVTLLAFLPLLTKGGGVNG